MRASRVAFAAAVLAAAPALAVVVLNGVAEGHGTAINPVSRIYQCFLEGPESPDSAACQAAVATGGTQPVYDWNEINQANAGGNHKAIVPDGRLCSGGRDKYAGFDLPRADWVASPISAGSFTFRFRATAPHQGTFELYMTKQGWNPAAPLKWSDLDSVPFARVTDPPLISGSYVFNTTIPSGRTGRHLIYTIWQRTPGISTEAFYACSDVTFGGVQPTTSPSVSPSASPTSSPTSSPTASPTPTATGQYPAWAAGVAYTAGTRVTYNGVTYQCRQAHTSLPGWEPPYVAALWLPV